MGDTGGEKNLNNAKVFILFFRHPILFAPFFRLCLTCASLFFLPLSLHRYLDASGMSKQTKHVEWKNQVVSSENAKLSLAMGMREHNMQKSG